MGRSGARDFDDLGCCYRLPPGMGVVENCLVLICGNPVAGAPLLVHLIVRPKGVTTIEACMLHDRLGGHFNITEHWDKLPVPNDGQTSCRTLLTS